MISSLLPFSRLSICSFVNDVRFRCSFLFSRKRICESSSPDELCSELPSDVLSCRLDCWMSTENKSVNLNIKFKFCSYLKNLMSNFRMLLWIYDCQFLVIKIISSVVKNWQFFFSLTHVIAAWMNTNNVTISFHAHPFENAA